MSVERKSSPLTSHHPTLITLPMNIIETHNLTKNYGKHLAVDKLNLAVPAGSVFGLIGPNGAGKTSTLRMLATLLEPSSGDANVGGFSIRTDMMRVRRVIGYMPDFFGVYTDMTCTEYMDFFAACYGVPKADRPMLINDLLQLVDLSHRKDDLVDKLSRGMKQRLGLARTLAHDPQVLLLDEPASGLDPRARVEMRELIKELRAMGKSIVLSSHILAELEDMCTHVAIVAEGTVKATGTLETIRARLRPHRTISIKFLGEPELALNVCKAAKGVVDVQVVGAPAANTQTQTSNANSPLPSPLATTASPLYILKEVLVAFNGDYNDASDLLRSLMHTGVQVVSFSEHSETLESLFMQLTAPA
jgi:ABC-2 type transport system ATP-binding protein